MQERCSRSGPPPDQFLEDWKRCFLSEFKSDESLLPEPRQDADEFVSSANFQRAQNNN
jgi:hypothetical protein